MVRPTNWTSFFCAGDAEPHRTRRDLPLTEAQDRFLFQVIVDYPTREERQIIEQTTSTFESKLEPVIDGPTLQKCQETVRKFRYPTMFTIMFST